MCRRNTTLDELPGNDLILARTITVVGTQWQESNLWSGDSGAASLFCDKQHGQRSLRANKFIWWKTGFKALNI
jgi:hypothetical protein